MYIDECRCLNRVYMSMRVFAHSANDHKNVGLWISCYTNAQMIKCTDDCRCVNRVYMSVRVLGYSASGHTVHAHSKRQWYIYSYINLCMCIDTFVYFDSTIVVWSTYHIYMCVCQKSLIDAWIKPCIYTHIYVHIHAQSKRQV